MAAVTSQAHAVQHDLFSFAKPEILGMQHPDAKSSPEQTSTKSDGQLAALGIRLMLELKPLRESAGQEAKLVEGHMCVTYSVPKHRQYLRGEPVLAGAAAGPLAAVSQYSKNGLVSKGEGELIAGA